MIPTQTKISSNPKVRNDRPLILKLPFRKVKELTKGKIEGLVKVKGVLSSTSLMNSKLTNERCIGYSYTVKYWRYDREDHSSKHWITKFSKSECNDFYIKDDTGKIKVHANDITILLWGNNETKREIDREHHIENILLQNEQEFIVVGRVVTNSKNEKVIEHDKELPLYIFDKDFYDIFLTSTRYRIGCGVFILAFALLLYWGFKQIYTVI